MKTGATMSVMIAVQGSKRRIGIVMLPAPVGLSKESVVAHRSLPSIGPSLLHESGEGNRLALWNGRGGCHFTSRNHTLNKQAGGAAELLTGREIRWLDIMEVRREPNRLVLRLPDLQRHRHQRGEDHALCGRRCQWGIDGDDGSLRCVLRDENSRRRRRLSLRSTVP